MWGGPVWKKKFRQPEVIILPEHPENARLENQGATQRRDTKPGQ